MMNRFAGILCVGAVMAGVTFAAGKGPEIQNIDGKISMQAESVPLARLLHLLDSATGMTSKVPPELANRNMSVRFTGLPFNAAVRKIFEGQALDYVVIGGKGIIVTAVAQSVPGAPAGQSLFAEQAAFPGQQGFAQDPDSPFGPLPTQPQQPNQQPVLGAVFPGAQQAPPAVVTPFGTLNPFSSNPFGTPGANTNPAPNNPATPLFGNTAPVPFQQKTAQPPPK